MDAGRPPLGVKLTVYRLLNMTILFSIGITKGILTYKGKSTAPTTLDWVGGAFLAVVLYWIGLYEQRDEIKWEWFFQVDLAPAIGYCTNRVVGGVMLPLLFLDGLFVFTLSLSSLLCMLASYLLNHYLPDWDGSFWGAYLGAVTYFCMNLTREARRRTRAWQRAMCFVDEYGPGAPLPKRYGWFGLGFGAVGTVLGLLCGIALVGLPLALLSIYF